MSEIIYVLEDLYEVLFYGYGIANLGIAGVALIYGVIVALVTTIWGIMVSLLVFVLEAIPLYKISKKMGRKYANLVWLSWIPVIGKHISTYVLADIPGDKPLNLTNTVIIQNRILSFWARVGIAVFGTSLITAFIGIVNLMPGLGQIVGTFSMLLYLVPSIAIAWIEYAYLKDVLDIFKPDQNSNRNTAIVIAILDSLATMGCARAFCLYTVMNKEPLDK